jgi:hypothetical protein
MLRIFRNSAAALILLSLALSAAGNTTTQIASIKSASTDGSPSDSTFSLVVAADTAANALTTTTALELSVAVTPSEAHRGALVDIYTVIVASNKFFKLAPDGGYVPWDGTVEDLTPFATGRMLGADNKFTLINGTLAEAGSYLYFTAYSAQGESRLHFTPEPAQLNIKASTTLPDDTHSAAAKTFDTEIESDIVQARCITCHVEGGLARSSALQFQRTNTASSLNNFGALSEYIESKGAELLLAKVAGGEGHVGGLQLAPDSDGYAAIEKVISELANVSAATSYVFSGSGDGASAREASFLSSVVMEPREATLRRATLLLQGRVPTEAEKKLASTEAGLRTALRALMKGPAFREFAVTATNDRLFVESTGQPINIALSNFLKLHNRRSEDNLKGGASDLYRNLNWAVNRAAPELVAYVVENEKPYSEILTANYMMMNPFLNEWLEGNATFDENDNYTIFKPAQVQGYYYDQDLAVVIYRPAMNNSIYKAIRPPVSDFPHAGILTDFSFLARYPTTATNRNRARARWVLYHYLGIDVEKSSQRPTDEASLADKNNPTMNNPNCTVCHALLDPVAGAFQNWGDFNLYRRDNRDSLDRFYKHPEDGSKSLYVYGDLWYRDMRAPGIFGKEISEKKTTLRALGEMITDEPAFLTATAKFWWPSVFGKPMLDKPAVESDQGYAAKYAAYQAQQASLENFAAALNTRMNAKDMLVEMFMSSWFGSASVTSYAFNSAQFEAGLGSEQLLSPEQLARKTRALTGVAWRTNFRPSGRIYSSYETLGVLIGGIDSEAVTTRATELTPTMTSILMTHATETSCPAVIRQFAKPRNERTLFTEIEDSTLPMVYDAATFSVASKELGDWHKVSLNSSVTAGASRVSVNFTNPWCDYDGSQCIEQRILYVDSLSITSPSVSSVVIKGNDPRLTSTVNNQDCYPDRQGYSKCYGGTLSLDWTFSEGGMHKLEVTMSSQLAPSRNESIKAAISVGAIGDPLTAKNSNIAAIKQQIQNLYSSLHGTEQDASSDAVTQVYEIFVAALSKVHEAHNGRFSQCNLWNDGAFFNDNLTQAEIETFRTSRPGEDWYHDSWEDRRVFEDVFTEDPFGTKYAWTAVMMYMLSHYDYLHE